MKIAYADPPYIGQARKHYSHDPRCAEVDHAELLAQLAKYDAWALSMSAAMYSMKEIIALAPDDARIAAWVKPFAAFKRGVDPAYTWEPVIYKTARRWDKGKNTIKDHIIEPITMRKGLAGAKPAAFCYWLFDLLGAEPTDKFHDFYPGTGIVTTSWHAWCDAKTCQPLQMILQHNAEAQLPPERAKPAEGTRSATALWAVNCSDLLGDCRAMNLPPFGERRRHSRLNKARGL